MAHRSRKDRAQLLLLPDAVDAYDGPDNSVRFIEAFVDGLDLAAASFVRVAAKETGRLGLYEAADLLTLYVYGYGSGAARCRAPCGVTPSSLAIQVRRHHGPHHDQVEQPQQV
jgi:hypothetical protein